MKLDTQANTNAGSKTRAGKLSSYADSREEMESCPKYIGDFVLRCDGLYKTAKGSGDNDSGVKLCGYLEVVARTSDANDSNHGVLVEWISVNGKKKKVAFTAASLHDTRNSVITTLADGGLEIKPGRGREILNYLTSAVPEKRMRSVEQPGWVRDGNGWLFVRPSEIIGTPRTSLTPVFQPRGYSSAQDSMTSRGDLRVYKSEIVERVKGEPILLFALGCGLAGPLMRHADLEGGGFHFYSETTHGKTTLAQVTASVVGNGVDPAAADQDTAGYIQRWNTTENGLEGIASSHNDSVLVLDELGTFTGKDLGRTVYNLTGGRGKIAMNANRETKRASTWITLIVSTGEKSIQERIKEDGKVAKGGQAVRIADIYLPKGTILNSATPATLSDQLKKACAEQYGLIGIQFIEKLLKEAGTDLKAYVNKFVAEALKRIESSGAQFSKEQRRVLKRFALVEAALKIASVILWKLNVSDQEIYAATDTVIQHWKTDADQSTDGARGVEAVRDFVTAHQFSRFAEKPTAQGIAPAAKVANFAGYSCEKSFYLTTAAFREACGGINSKLVANELAANGLLGRDAEGRDAKNVKITGVNQRLYVISRDILGTFD